MIKEIIANLRDEVATSFSEWIAEWELADKVKIYEKRGICENYIKETKYDRRNYLWKDKLFIIQIF
ncbi:MAG TPA: hypothetical protein DCW46_10555 [Desulfotomaculum sp.]|nr:hypothetical protein [Desulfotomaculum sp.]